MTPYSNLNEAFYDPSVEELDKIAREVNSSNKRKDLLQSVQNEYVEHVRKSEAVAKMVNNQPFKYFSTQGNMTATDTELQSFPESLIDFDNEHTYTGDTKSIDSGEHAFDHIKKCQECKQKFTDMLKKKRVLNKYTHSEEEINDDAIENMQDTNNTNNTNDSNNSYNMNGYEIINKNEIRDILLVILIGIVIIMLLDIFSGITQRRF